MYPIRQTFFVLGLSRSGKAAAEFLLSEKAQVYIYDDQASERTEQIARALAEKGAKRITKEDFPRMAELCDALVISPGIPIDHPMAVAFKRNGKAVLGETELAARYMRCPVLAVTGTNGKTTTVSMLKEVLERGGYRAIACGNIGAPMLDFCKEDDSALAVAEISSFQLETLNSLCPHVSMILNITEDHLNRHYNMENYVFLKRKLLKNATETEYAVLNYDDPIVRSFAEDTKAQVFYFSVKERVKGGYYENGALYFGKEKIMAVSQLLSEGLHNIQNALAVIVAAKIMGVKTENIVAALAEFKGIKHRIEFIGEIDGIRFVDDSKGTNVDATIKAVESMKSETLLLLGGKNKGDDYGKLFSALRKSRVVHAVLYGENRYMLLKSAREYDYSSVTVCEEMEFAVRIALLKAKRGQTVLLSPAGASFDQFASYEERGDKFVEIVRAFQQEKERSSQGESGDGATVAETEERFADRREEEIE